MINVTPTHADSFKTERNNDVCIECGRNHMYRLYEIRFKCGSIMMCEECCEKLQREIKRRIEAERML